MPAPACKVALTDRFLQALKPDPAGSRIVIWDAIMPSLAVRVSAKGKRSFYAVKRRLGDTSPSWVMLGVYPGGLLLADARKKAGEVLGALSEGQHPKKLAAEKRQAAEQKRREAEASTFRAVAEGFERAYLPRMAQSSARMYRSYLSRARAGARRDAGRRDQATRHHQTDRWHR